MFTGRITLQVLLLAFSSVSVAQAQRVNWTTVFNGSDNTDKIIGGIVAHADTAFFVGSSRGLTGSAPIPFGFFLAAKPNSGATGWTASIPSLDNTITSQPFGGIARNSKNEIVIAGNIRGRLTFGSGVGAKTLSVNDYMGVSSPNLVLPFLARYTSKGVFIDARILAGGNNLGAPTSANVFVRDIVTDSKNNIYVAGTFLVSATWDLGLPSAIVHSSNNPPLTARNGFVAKYDRNLKLIWVIPIQANTFDSFVESICLDIAQDKEIVIGGGFYKTVTFRSRNNSFIDLTAYQPGDNAVQSQTAYFARMDTAGQFLWVKKPMEKPINISDDGRWLNDLEVDSDGNIYIAGSLGGGAVLGMGQPNQTTLPWIYEYTAFAGKFDPSGNYVWYVRGVPMTGGTFAAGRKIACTDNGNCIFGGEFNARQFQFLSYNKILMAESGNPTPFLLQLSESGNATRLTQFTHGGTLGTIYGGYRTNGLTALFMEDFENVYAGGHFFRSMTFAEGFSNQQVYTAPDNTTALFLTNLEWETPPPVVTGLEPKGAVSVYPIPATKMLTIQTTDSQAFSVELFNLYGQRVSNVSGIGVVSLDTDAFAAGMYLSVIRLESGETISQKVLIQH